jgi:hypothetical protein
MTQSPETSDQRRMTDTPVTRNNRGNSDYVIGVGSVPHPQEEAQHDDRQQVYQIHVGIKQRPELRTANPVAV